MKKILLILLGIINTQAIAEISQKEITADTTNTAIKQVKNANEYKYFTINNKKQFEAFQGTWSFATIYYNNNRFIDCYRRISQPTIPDLNSMCSKIRTTNIFSFKENTVTIKMNNSIKHFTVRYNPDLAHNEFHIGKDTGSFSIVENQLTMKPINDKSLQAIVLYRVKKTQQPDKQVTSQVHTRQPDN